MSRVKSLTVFFPAVLIAAFISLSGCENSLKDLQKISAAEVSKPVQRFTDVDVIYSDSAKVKAHMTAPLMLDYTPPPKDPNSKSKDTTASFKPYTEMPKGVKVTFYNDSLKQTCTIVADYGIRKVADKVIELHKNVVGTNVKGETFTSDELIWDEGSHQIHSNVPVHVRMTDGSILDGLDFVSDEGLNHWKFGRATGIIHVDSKEVPTTGQ